MFTIVIYKIMECTERFYIICQHCCSGSN